MEQNGAGPDGPISVFLADDNLIVREGVRALINARKDLTVVGVAADYDELVSGAEASPAAGARHRHPDAADVPRARASTPPARCASATRAPGSWCSPSTTTPSTRSSLLAEGSAGYGYLLKDRVAEGNQLVDAIRDGGDRRHGARPVDRRGAGRPGRPGRRPAARRGGAARHGRRGQDDQGDRGGAAGSARGGGRARSRRYSSSWPSGVSAASDSALRRLRLLHQAIVDREEQGETLSRLLPGGLAEQAAAGAAATSERPSGSW